MDKFFRKLATVMAMLGGVVLVCLICITCVSILGRILNSIGHYDFVETRLSWLSALLTKFGPIVGDFELVESGIAFAIMAFIPLCQLNRAHASVEIITSMFPAELNRLLAFIWETTFAFVIVIIAWRLYVGTTDKLRYGETTFMLQFPIWWGYAACTAAAVIAAIVAIWSAWKHFGEIRSGRSQASGEMRS